MQQPLQITFRGIPHSDAVKSAIEEKAKKLDHFYEKIMSCRVVVEAPHTQHQHGNIFHIRIDITVPGGELVANRSPSKHQAHEDIYVAIRDAFDAAKRQLQNFNRKQKGQVKFHESQAHGRVTQLDENQDYGRLQTSEGRDIYFHRNSLVRGEFDELEVGSEVRYVEEAGDEGPQASTVHVVGKHHIEED